MSYPKLKPWLAKKVNRIKDPEVRELLLAASGCLTDGAIDKYTTYLLSLEELIGKALPESE